MRKLATLTVVLGLAALLLPRLVATAADPVKPASSPAAASKSAAAAAAAAAAKAKPPNIVDKPIDYGPERTALTIAYRKVHYGKDRDSITITPKMIVLHWTEAGSLKSLWNGFNRVKIDPSRKRLAEAGELNVSAQFLVDRDGTVYRLMPEDSMARHTIGLNEVAIGVENIGDDDKQPLTDAQVTADAALVRYLAKKWPITHLIGHLEYRDMEGHPYFHELVDGYRNSKPDPGTAFMTKVRALVADLKLEGPPAKAPRKAKHADAAVRSVQIVSSVGDGPADESAKHARLDQPVKLYAVVAAGGTLYSDAPRLHLGGKAVPAAPLADAPELVLDWFKIEPAAENMSNMESGQFKFEPIAYLTTALVSHQGSLSADVHPTRTPDRGDGVGTMRYQLVAELPDGRTVATPGTDARRGGASGGLGDGVHRISIRRDDSYVGWLTELYGQPYIWASAGASARTHQSERLEGSDCADFVTYGWRRLGHDVPYTWTEGLHGFTTRLAAGQARADGVYVDAKGKPLPFTAIGDLILFPRHVGVLVEDRGVKGVLDTQDRIAHSLFESPHEVAIADSGYAGTAIELLRWKK